jgi:hypothetical protein
VLGSGAKRRLHAVGVYREWCWQVSGGRALGMRVRKTTFVVAPGLTVGRGAMSFGEKVARETRGTSSRRESELGCRRRKEKGCGEENTAFGEQRWKGGCANVAVWRGGGTY